MILRIDWMCTNGTKSQQLDLNNFRPSLKAVRYRWAIKSRVSSEPELSVKNGSQIPVTEIEVDE